MAETVEKLKVELDINAGSFNKQMSNINKEIKRSENEFKQASKGVKGFENSFTGLDSKIQKTAKQLDLYSAKLTKQKTEYERLENVVEKQKSKLNELESTLGKGSKEWQKQEQLVQKNSEKLSKLGTDIGKTENNINKLENELKDSQQAFEQLGNKTKSAGEKLADIDNKAALAESEFNKLGSELEQNGTFFQKLGNEMNQLSSKIDTQVQKINVYENEIEQLGNELKQNKNIHEQLATEIKQTEQALSKAQSEYGQNSTEAQQLRTKLLALKDSYNQIETEIEHGTRELNQYQTELNQTQTEVNNLSRELRQMPFEETGNKLKSTGQNLKSVGQTMTASVTVPILGAGVAAGKMAYDYDQGLAKVGSLVQKSGKEMKQYDKIIKDMSKNTGVSLGDLTEAMYQCISAGGDLENVFEVTEIASKLAIGGFTSTETAIDGLTSAMNAFGIQYDKADDVANKFLLTQNKGKTTVDELAGSIGKVAPVANAAGVGLDELLAAVASLTMNGIATSEAMTALKAALSNVIKPSAEAQKISKKLGLEFNSTALQSKGLAGFLEDVKKKTGGNIDTMAKLFGSTEALNSILLLTGEGAETFNSVLGDMGGELNLLDEAFEGMTEGSGAKFKKSLNDMKVAITDLGDTLAPVIEFLSEKIQQLANWFSGLDEKTQQNIVTFGLLAAAIGPILMGVGQLLIIGGNCVTLFGAISGGAGTAAGATGGLTGAMGVLAGPVGIGLAIAALVALMAYVGDSEGAILGLQEKFGGLGTIIGSVCEFISGIIQMTFGNMIIYISGAMDAIAAIIDGPGGQTLEDSQTRMQNRLIINTEEAMGKLAITTTRGMSQMRHMTEQELGGLVATTDTIMQQIPLIAEGNYTTAGTSIATQLQAMDSNQLLVLRGMNDTTKALFQGINENMTVEQMSNQVQVNMKQMAATGKFEANTMSKDITSAMDTLKQQVETKTKQASTSANTNTQQLANNIDKNTQQASQNADKNTQNLGNKIDANTKTAGSKTDTNTKDMAKQIDANTQDATNKAEANMKNMASKAETESKNTRDNAVKNANKMKADVSSATKQMADNAIRDWNRIKNEYARGITGKVNITKTTTNVVKTQQADAFEALNNVARFNTDDYKIDGAYYRSGTKASMSVTENTVNMDLRRIEKMLAEKQGNETINLNFNFDKVEIKNEDDYKTMAKKVAGYVDIELNKIKNKNKKIKGRLVNA